ncbi:alternative oxidase [Aquibaculum arenosum]|uniref:Alternative oxidase n=1 Tax=Aquibaculum arenosum TaxID=3032591 RepID=A0ABT5YR91_9PROT|nr:alternative oxidase [Fodinicurvata sp. CAU 1616]MDF2097433.1 alternative oxidase [Fodinicurvata sp. CAU 1616]
MLDVDKTDLHRHHLPQSVSDRFALGVVRALYGVAGRLFPRRYRHRTIVLETVAAVPGMVAATLLHLKCLRRMIDDRGWVRAMMDEAENQRTHLMVFVAIDRPNLAERLLVLLAQGLFYNTHFLVYLLSPRTAHRIAGYLAEEAARGYGQYLAELRAGEHEDPPAPALAIAYWNLPPEARLSEAVQAMQEDETIHRDINHAFATALAKGRDLPAPPQPLL